MPLAEDGLLLLMPATDGEIAITKLATAHTRNAARGLPSIQAEVYVLRGSLPKEAGPLWFKVMQICEKGSIDWAEVPASGNSTKGLKFPAALLEIIESGAMAHQH